MLKPSYEEVIINPPLVTDNGSGILKAGFAGDEAPKCCFPTLVGRPKYNKVMAGAVEGDTFVGDRAVEYRGLLSLRYPITHGIIEDWPDMESIWMHMFSVLKAHSEEHPVLVSEAPLNPAKNKEKLAEVFFETFNSPALFVSPQAVLALYSSGRTTGVVLDSGDGVTHVVPIYCGFSSPHAITRSDVAGRDVTHYLSLLLRQAGYIFHTSAELEVVKSIKETSCYISFNPLMEEPQKKDRGKSNSGYPVKLPDGTQILVGEERYSAPEILFHPSIIGLEYAGIHELLITAISRCDIDLRRSLYSQIVLSGGSTLFSGFGDRLLNEIRKFSPKDVKIRIFAPPERKYSTWVGGSILASLSSFNTMWISKKEYEEDGALSLHKKSL